MLSAVRCRSPVCAVARPRAAAARYHKTRGDTHKVLVIRYYSTTVRGDKKYYIEIENTDIYDCNLHITLLVACVPGTPWVTCCLEPQLKLQQSADKLEATVGPLAEMSSHAA